MGYTARLKKIKARIRRIDQIQFNGGYKRAFEKRMETYQALEVKIIERRVARSLGYYLFKTLYPGNGEISGISNAQRKFREDTGIFIGRKFLNRMYVDFNIAATKVS